MASYDSKSSVLKKAFKVTIPVLFGYLAIGIPFGLMLVKANYPWWLAPIMSVLMYAGAGQYLAVGLFSAGATIPAMIVATLLVNIRHIVYGLSLISPFKNVGKWKPYLVFALTDETYALLTGVSVPKNVEPGRFYGFIALLDHLYWIIGGVIGALAGELLPFTFEGVDFALTSLFIVLLIDQLKRTKDYLPSIIGFSCAVACLLIFGAENMLISSLGFALFVLVIVRRNGK